MKKQEHLDRVMSLIYDYMTQDDKSFVCSYMELFNFIKVIDNGEWTKFAGIIIAELLERGDLEAFISLGRKHKGLAE